MTKSIVLALFLLLRIDAFQDQMDRPDSDPDSDPDPEYLFQMTNPFVQSQ